MRGWRIAPVLGLLCLRLGAQSDPPGSGVSADQLDRRIEQLEQRIRELEAELAALKELAAAQRASEEAAAAVEEPPAAPMAEVIPTEGTTGADIGTREIRMPVSGYMDFHFNKAEAEAGVLDLHRFVLLFGHTFNRRIQFWSELELEHALVSSEEESGELELEQAYLDFLIQPWFNFRAGIVLTPVGLINERHEPPSFNGVERPFVDTFIIPTTWFGPGAGFHGDLGRGFLYKAYVMDTLDSSRFSAESGVRDGRQKAFQASLQNPAFTGRLEYHGLPGASFGASFWTGKTGFATPGINPRLKLIEFDGRISLRRFDFRGQFAQTHLSRTAELNTLLQRTTGVNPNVAERMRGFYAEAGYHILPVESRHDLVGFVRYENFDTQNKMAPGFVPLRQFDRDAFVIGLTYYPEPDVALKFDYGILRNQSAFVKAPNIFNVGIGWWF